jgi:ParB-like chromosome segregation protein Spo0J
VKIAIADLSLDPNNARKHSQRNLDAIAASLKQFGQRKPIVVHRGVVLAGNGTVEAAKTLGWTEIELDPKYCDVIVTRWENLTGEKATLVNSE